jgi:hypothetical protein
MPSGEQSPSEEKPFSLESPDLWKRFRKEGQRDIIISSKKKIIIFYISGLSESIFSDSKPFWRFFKSKSSKSSLPDVQ